MKKCSLQLQMTLMVGVILLAACLILTMNSLFSARSYYGDYAALLEEGLVEYDPALLEGAALPITNAGQYYKTASEKFSVQSVFVMALIVILALAVTYWAAGRILRSLKELTRSAHAVDDRHLDKRVQLSGAQGEVLELAEAFNRMLERLENAFFIQKSFASNAAHELKTPLAVIKSSLQVLEMNPDPETEDYHEFMHDTGQSLERIIKTVDGLLSLANLEDAPTDIIVELSPLLEQAVQELSGGMKKHGVKPALFVDESAQVHGNPDLLYRVFYNLIENALKYNRMFGTITVRLKRDEDYVRVQVEDTGIGIEKEALSHIYEPFYRADESRSQRIPGSGLGLAVVKLIIDRHGGKIQAESEVNNGTVFTVELKY